MYIPCTSKWLSRNNWLVQPTPLQAFFMQNVRSLLVLISSARVLILTAIFLLFNQHDNCVYVCLTFIYSFLSPGYGLLHSLVFTRMFPTLITLYVLHHEDNDTGYQRGLDFLRDMDDERVVTYIKFPESVKTNICEYMHACSNVIVLLKLCVSIVHVCVQAST